MLATLMLATLMLATLMLATLMLATPPPCSIGDDAEARAKAARPG